MMMNRDIKFRAWDIGNSTMVDDSYNDDHYILTLDKCKPVLLEYSGDDFGEYREIDSVIEQFTGLKDSTGKEVYEGDVLSRYHFTDSDGDHFINHIVEWSDKYNGWFALNAESMNADDGSVQLWVYVKAGKYSMKVIGNIHENSDLINKTNKGK